MNSLINTPTDQQLKDQGYQAQATDKSMQDNPYDPKTEPTKHWLWRAGFIEAFKDSN